MGTKAGSLVLAAFICDLAFSWKSLAYSSN